MTPDDQNWDFIIVGGGSAGCPIANRLSANPNVRVLLLDAGKSDGHLFTRMPAGQMCAFSRPDMNWAYFAEPDASRNGRIDMWPAGKRLGGGSAINGMMFVRGHPSDYDQWAQMGNSGWSYDDVLPAFRRMESYERGETRWRGGSGPLSVSEPRSPHKLADAFIAAAGELGVPVRDDLNAEHPADGAGFVQTTQREGIRETTALAYVHPVRRRPNFTLSLESTVTKVILNGRRAVGVQFRRDGQTHEARAGKGVIIAAGAIASPKLLMLSGIGAAAQLRKFGIDVAHELPGVGQNLLEHPGANIVFEIDVPTLTSDLGPIRSPIHALNYALFQRGPLATSIGHAQAFVRTREGLAAPNIQIIYSPLHHEVRDGKAIPVREPLMSIAIGLCRVNGRGELRLRSADPNAPPVIDHQLLKDADDLRQLAEGCAFGARLLGAPSMRNHVVSRRAPERADLSIADWEQYVRNNAFLMFHPAGTCRMGRDPMAVVDERLRVHGLEGLWIADASIMPTLPAGNINATCIMIGEKASDFIQADAA